jgi:hypothetical protein
MKLQQVIDQALADPNFAKQLKNKALNAHRAGKGTDEWSTFMEHFAENEEQLANFNSLTGPGGGGCTPTIVTTLTAASTAACTLTTTTTTTTIFCD